MSDSIEVSSRQATGTQASRRLRRQGLVPAILYGHGEKCIDLSTKREALELIVRHGSRVVELTGAVKTSALVRELQWDTFGVEPIHVDFLRVSASDSNSADTRTTDFPGPRTRESIVSTLEAK